MSLFLWKKKQDIDKKSDKKSDKVSVAEKNKEEKSMKDLYAEKSVRDNRDKRIKNKFYNSYKILIKPLKTEKVTNLGAENKYVFEVAKNTNKIEITKAIRNVYGINPISVNIITMSGKQVKHGRTIGRRKNWKKAIVTLPKGESINVYESV